jgi:hypothetical protein
MGTLPPPSTQKFPDDSIERKVYNLVERLAEYLPLPNDRNRLGFNLYKLMKGEGDKPEVILLNAKLTIKGISEKELAKKIDEELKKI